MKKIISIVLSIIMITSTVPIITVSAENATGSIATDTGSLNYSIENGEVTITSGSSGTNVEIPAEIEGYPVTSISEGAFESHNSLKSIVIPNSVTYIGSRAFFDCDGLTSINIPDSVTSIAEETFAYCTYLENINIPNSVTSVGNGAFYACQSLILVNYFGSKDEWNLISIDSSNEELTKAQLIYNTTEIIDQGSISTDTATFKYIIIDGEAKILKLYNLKKDVVIPSEIEGYPVTTLGYKAAEFSSSIESILIPTSITYIAEDAFDNCLNLILVNYTGSEDEWNLINIYNSSGNYWLVYTEKVYNSTDLTKIYSVPTDTGTLEYIIIDNEIRIVKGSGTDIEIPSYIDSLPVSVIGRSAFQVYGNNNYTLESVTIPDTVTSIGKYAFKGCLNLESIFISKSVTNINDAFDYCKNLCVVFYSGSEEDWELIDIDPFALSDCNINIVYNATEIEDICSVSTDTGRLKYVIANGEAIILKCLSGTNIVIPDKIQNCPVTVLGNYSFYECDDLASIAIPNTVTNIGNYAFAYCSNIESIVIPEAVTSLGQFAFSNCTKLANVTIPNSVTNIGDWAFQNCESMENIIIPESVTYLGWRAFENCIGLKSIIIPDSITEISGTFSGCKSLESVTLSDSITSLGIYTFSGCSSLVNINIPDGVTSIGNGSFENCSSLESIKIPDTVTTIDSYAFYGCSNLKSITIPNGVTSIGDINTFAFCSSLKNIIIPDSITNICFGAFQNCTDLESITIPHSVTQIQGRAFEGCTSLKNITLPEHVIYLGYNAFSGCFNLESITIPDSITEIHLYTFFGCTNLQSVTLSNAVEVIGYASFHGVDNLKTINYLGTKEDWDNIMIEERNDSLLNAEIIYNYGKANTTTTINGIETGVTVGEQVILTAEKFLLNGAQGWAFDYWNIKSGNAVLDYDKETIDNSFIMPEENVVVNAVTYLIGNVDGDDVVAATDMLTLAGSIKYSAECTKYLDVDNDGVLAATDLLVLAQIIKGTYDYSDYTE